MTAPRKPDFDLQSALQDRGYTPRVRDVPRLLELVGAGGALSVAAERAVARVGLAAAAVTVERAGHSAPPARARLVALAGRLASEHPDSDLRAFLIAKLSDDDDKTRRNAAMALGKIHMPDVEPALARALEREACPQVRRSLVEALGKTGGRLAQQALHDAPASDAAQVNEARAKALLMANRTLGREAASAFAASRPAPGPTVVHLRCRAGLESILASEIDAELSPKPVQDGFGPGRVQVTLAGAPERLFQARTMLSFGFPVAVPCAPGDDIAAPLIEALSSAEARHILTHWTNGPLRYRIAWAQGGKRRASVWRAASEISRRHPELINDPTDSTWEAAVHQAGGQLLVELSPRVSDPRFFYRRADVPASSHPTIAAALVRIAAGPIGRRPRYDPGEVVWDPFVGAGGELCERALAGPFRLLIGSDRDQAALSVARDNLAAAGAHDVQLLRGNALDFRPPSQPGLILTNPPMGRRILRGADLGAFLERFLEHAARVLAPHGRIVWVSPLPHRTAIAAQRLGLSALYRQEVDMGGFAAEIQVLRKDAPGSSGARAAPKTRPVAR